MKRFMFTVLLVSLFIGVRNVDAKTCAYYYCTGTMQSPSCSRQDVEIDGNSCPYSTTVNGKKMYSDMQSARFNMEESSSGTSNQNPSTGTNPGTGPNTGGGPSGGTGGGYPVSPNDPSHDATGGGSDELDNSDLSYKSCGNLEKIPAPIPKFTSFAYNALKILTPVVLIIMGMFELMKSIMAGKEDEMKKTQTSFVKKLLIAALVFILASIVQFVVKFTAKSEDSGPLISCMECFLNDNC